MSAMSATAGNFAKTRSAKTCTKSTAFGTANAAIACAVREIYSSKTAETLAVWLKLALRTAKHRLAGTREFTVDELETLLHSEHGFKILVALMRRAKRPPSWWAVCEPLMDLADAELLVAAIRERTSAVIAKREETADELTTEIRRTQALAIHGPGPAREHLRALQSYAGADRRVVAAKTRGVK
jgi:hypothetical protein